MKFSCLNIYHNYFYFLSEGISPVLLHSNEFRLTAPSHHYLISLGTCWGGGEATGAQMSVPLLTFWTFLKRCEVFLRHVQASFCFDHIWASGLADLGKRGGKRWNRHAGEERFYRNTKFGFHQPLVRCQRHVVENT